MINIDWLAGLLEILAKYIVGKKNRWGWMVHLVAGILWFYVACQIKVYGIFVIVVPAFFLNIWNFIKWSRDGRENKLDRKSKKIWRKLGCPTFKGVPFIYIDCLNLSGDEDGHKENH